MLGKLYSKNVNSSTGDSYTEYYGYTGVNITLPTQEANKEVLNTMIRNIASLLTVAIQYPSVSFDYPLY